MSQSKRQQEQKVAQPTWDTQDIYDDDEFPWPANLGGTPYTGGPVLRMPVPAESLTKQLRSRRTGFTPDFFELKNFQSLPVFVYDTLRRGEFDNKLLNECGYLGKALTTIARFDFRSRNKDTYGMIDMTGASHESKGKVRGEVYAVTPIDLLTLDEFYKNGKAYTRKKLWITFEEQPYMTSEGGQKRPAMEVYAYVASPHAFPTSDTFRCQYDVDGFGNRIFDLSVQRQIERKYAVH